MNWKIVLFTLNKLKMNALYVISNIIYKIINVFKEITNQLLSVESIKSTKMSAQSVLKALFLI